jgi:hypothetical protein
MKRSRVWFLKLHSHAGQDRKWEVGQKRYRIWIGKLTLIWDVRMNVRLGEKKKTSKSYETPQGCLRKTLKKAVLSCQDSM